MPDISPGAAAYIELGLEAIRAGNIPRAVGALCSIDRESWNGMAERFPGLFALLDSNLTAAVANSPATAALDAGPIARASSDDGR